MPRRLFAAVSAAAVLAMAGSNSAQGYPYCLTGGDWGWPGLCYFSTYGQCMASASGTRSYCEIDPHYAFAAQRPGYWQGYSQGYPQGYPQGRWPGY